MGMARGWPEPWRCGISAANRRCRLGFGLCAALRLGERAGPEIRATTGSARNPSGAHMALQRCIATTTEVKRQSSPAQHAFCPCASAKPTGPGQSTMGDTHNARNVRGGRPRGVLTAGSGLAASKARPMAGEPASRAQNVRPPKTPATFHPWDGRARGDPATRAAEPCKLRQKYCTMRPVLSRASAWPRGRVRHVDPCSSRAFTARDDRRT